jgi:hypothetical protein
LESVTPHRRRRQAYNRRMRLRTLSAALALALACLSASVWADQAAWEQWQHVPGVVDVGARADGTLVLMAAGHLYLLSGSGATSPFAAGPDGFSADPNAEPYFVVAQPLSVDSAGCSWTADDLLILDLTSPPGIVRVDANGHASRLASLGGVDTLGGIALDTTGRFDHRLLVTGTHGGNQTTVFTVDCQGRSTTLTTSAPQVEGGIAVAPDTFGQFAGELIAPDENTGQVWAIDPDGNAALVAVPNLPTGGDTGVESAGFVPSGFGAGGVAYLADRGTPNNPFPGTDSLLRISSDALATAGVQPGDLLVSTEGNGTTIGIRCADTCSVYSAAQGTDGGHIEGHLLVIP